MTIAQAFRALRRELPRDFDISIYRIRGVWTCRLGWHVGEAEDLGQAIAQALEARAAVLTNAIPPANC